MAGVIPIPSSRVSGYLLRTRLTQQFQKDQLDLFRLQEQIATGQRIVLPSDDGPAALRSISLQRMIDRKKQLASNVQTGQQFLAATNTALDNIATKLAEIKGATLGVAGTISSDTERETAINEINDYLEQLVTIANRQYLGRSLFSGTSAGTDPYSFVDGNVVYNGDANLIENYSDFGVLFSTSISGQEVFGGTSAQVEGTVDLNPQLNMNTSLSSLRNGRGITSGGAIQVSDGTNVSIIDLSGARTIGDVVRQIQNNPPAGRQVNVSVTPTGLNLRITGGPSGANLSVQEVGNGTTARELGILNINGVGTSQLVGEDLNPQLLKTTRLEDLLGGKARATIQSVNSNNDILIEASANGAGLNGVTVQLVDDNLLQSAGGLVAGNEVADFDNTARAAQAVLKFTGASNDLMLTASTAGTAFNNVSIVVNGNATPGNEQVSYDSINGQLNISLDSSATYTVGDIEALIDSEGTFTADVIGNSAAAIDNSDFGNLQGDTGNSGGAANTLYVRIQNGVTTANQVIAAINAEGTFTATVDLSDSTSAANAGTGAIDINATGTTSGGSGTSLNQTSGLRIVNGGEVHEITFENAETLEDMLNVLNRPEYGLQAEINSAGTGISIRSKLSGNDFQIGENGGNTATQLGLRTYDRTTRLEDLNYGVGVLVGDGYELPAAPGADFTIQTQDGSTFQIDLAGGESLAQVATAINTATSVLGVPQVQATIPNPPGNALRLDDITTPNGTDSFTITRAAGSDAANYLGLVADGEGETTTTGSILIGGSQRYTDFTLNFSGQNYGIDLSGTETIGDVIDRINATTGTTTASLASTGNGIALNAGGPITVTRNGQSQTAEMLGFIPKGETSATGTGNSLTSTDKNFLENKSVFNTLIRLRDALENNDLNAVERALEDINVDIDRVTFARAEVGATAKGLDLSKITLEDEQIQLKSALSEELDVDLVQAISELTSRQIAMQASLQVTANIMQLSLLDFI
jgi:flagellar hook-associated protein 3 FlgL